MKFIRKTANEEDTTRRCSRMISLICNEHNQTRTLQSPNMQKLSEILFTTALSTFPAIERLPLLH